MIYWGTSSAQTGSGNVAKKELMFSMQISNIGLLKYSNQTKPIPEAIRQEYVL